MPLNVAPRGALLPPHKRKRDGGNLEGEWRDLLQRKTCLSLQVALKVFTLILCAKEIRMNLYLRISHTTKACLLCVAKLSGIHYTVRQQDGRTK